MRRGPGGDVSASSASCQLRGWRLFFTSKQPPHPVDMCHPDHAYHRRARLRHLGRCTEALGQHLVRVRGRVRVRVPVGVRVRVGAGVGVRVGVRRVIEEYMDMICWRLSVNAEGKKSGKKRWIKVKTST